MIYRRNVYSIKWDGKLHAKFIGFSRARDLQKLRFSSCEEIEKDKIAPRKSWYSVENEFNGGSSDTETVWEQCCDLHNYPGGTPEDHTKNPIHQRLIEIMHERRKGDISTLCGWDINLVAKYVNEMNKMKC